MGKINDFSPDDIANWISEDPRRGTISETYKLIRVNPGNTPIDELINAVEDLYMDFNINNKKFIQLATKVFSNHGLEYPQSKDTWFDLIDASSQNSQLKYVLKAEISGSPIKTVDDVKIDVDTKSKGFRIHFKNGLVRDYADIEDSGRDFYYVAIGPEGRYIRNLWTSSNHRHNRRTVNAMNNKPQRWVIGKAPRSKPGAKEKYFQKYKVHTIKKDNITKIEKL